jgi:hypothetical protein
MSADIISFPGDGLPDHQFTEAEIDKCHGDAFRDLEMSLRDCVRMSEIAAERCRGPRSMITRTGGLRRLWQTPIPTNRRRRPGRWASVLRPSCSDL